MIDLDALLAERPSAFELVLCNRFESRGARPRPLEVVPAPGGRTYVLACEPHGRRPAGPSAEPAGAELPSAGPAPAELASFARLLERGAEHLALAKAAQLRTCRDAAVQARC